MTILSNVDYFKELPYFNEVIEKPKIKHLINQAFTGYAISYKIEIVEKKDLIVQ